ncbi:ATP-binding protein [Vibrio gangliei]|uniref:ATP-binding protein n=1 Tax=Vibrio gangliei TaxID=2077090 RepID=UPI000D01DBB6|nr:sensor histidine kinase [Vibrio gangliei]
MNKIAFRTKVFLLLFSLLCVQVAVMVWQFDRTLLESIKHQVGTRALVQAKEIASDPELIKQVQQRDISGIKPHIERLAKISDASFIVIGDKQGIRLAHPTPTSVGHPMQGGDNVGVLERGESYVTLREGSLGYGLRGKTPIFDENHEIIGVVSVGYLLNRFDQWLNNYMQPLLIEMVVILLLTMIASWAFSRHIQQQMNGMEPHQIALALNLQKSILSSVYEGVIAIDSQGYFLALNDSARKIIGTQHDMHYLKKRQIIEYVANSEFFFHQPLDENLKDEMIQLNGHNLIANRVAIFNQQQIIGWVISFRAKDEIYSLTTDLTQIKQYSDNLRVQRHEYSNRLATISGLLQMGKIDEVQSLIASENSNKQQLLDFVQRHIELDQVAGLLLGKSLRAKELGLKLQLDPTCQLSHLNCNLSETELCAILGNLIENAFDSTLKNANSSRVVEVLLSDAGQDLVIEVTDNGTGIDAETVDHIWKRGFTCKPDKHHHGIGLYLVNQYVTQANGIVTVNDAEPQGCIFSVFIPNQADSPQ